jgi:hypothetical protein
MKKETEESNKKVSFEIIGYGIDKLSTIPYPIFKSEKNTYKGVIYKTIEDAKNSSK